MAIIDITKLNVIAGPNCAASLVTNVELKIRELADSQKFSIMTCKDSLFADGELKTVLRESVRKTRVFFLQPTNSPAQNHEYLCLGLNAAALASAESLTAIPTYCGYLRSDRKDEARSPIGAKVMLRQIENAMSPVPYRHIIFLHPHFKQVQGFLEMATSDILVPTSFFQTALMDILRDEFAAKNVIFEAPDVGAAELAETYTNINGLEEFAIGMKRRAANDSIEIVRIINDTKVAGKVVIIVDDIIDTGGTFVQTVYKLHACGAKAIYGVATHGVFAGKAIERIEEAATKTCFQQILVTNSINHDHLKLNPKLFRIVDIGALIGEAIFRTATGGSITEIAGAFPEKK